MLTSWSFLHIRQSQSHIADQCPVALNTIISQPQSCLFVALLIIIFVSPFPFSCLSHLFLSRSLQLSHCVKVVWKLPCPAVCSTLLHNSKVGRHNTNIAGRCGALAPNQTDTLQVLTLQTSSLMSRYVINDSISVVFKFLPAERCWIRWWISGSVTAILPKM